MELHEVTKSVSDSDHKEWLVSISYDFPFRCSSGTLKKIGFSSIFEFVEHQITGYHKVGKELPSFLNSSKEFFEGLKKELIDFLNKSNNLDQNNLKSRWLKIKDNNRNTYQNPLYLFDFKSLETEFLIEINKTIPGALTGAFNFIVGQKVDTDKFSLIGAFKAYEISNESSTAFSRSKGEKISFGKLTSRYEESLDKAESKLVDWISKSNDEVKDFSKAIDEVKNAKETLFSNWFLTSQTEFSKLSEQINARKLELEKTYGEHLRLKKPAEYWETRALNLGKDGRNYLIWLYVLIGIGATSLFILLWQIPDGMFLQIFSGDANAIKWTIVYVTFISFLAFGIKTLSKLAYSAYHLKRDAEERYQLTMVYLSLINESKIEEKDRQLILQSLFSRADTGLLKDDSSPTMPGLIGSVFNKPG